MARFTVRDVLLDLPDGLLTDDLRARLSCQDYEQGEAAALDQHLRPGDRVLELGAGCGFLAVLMARRVGARNVTTVEANPTLLAVIRANLAANDADDVRLLEGAVLGRAGPGKAGAGGKGNGTGGRMVRFGLSHGFWAGAVGLKGRALKRRIAVPALDFDALLVDVAPTVLVVDTEGAEQGYFRAPLPADLRLIVLELHPQHYGPRVINALIRRLMRRGFAFQPYGSRGAVMCFERLKPERQTGGGATHEQSAAEG